MISNIPIDFSIHLPLVCLKADNWSYKCQVTLLCEAIGRSHFVLLSLETTHFQS